MEYIGFTLLTASVVDPGRAVLAAVLAALAGGVIFLKRNSRNLRERLRKSHGQVT